MQDKYKQHVYIIGSKGIPAKYGGFETFVEKLTKYQVDSKIKYHIACTSENSKKSDMTGKHFEYNGADCFNIDVPNIGPAKAIFYDVLALKYSIQQAKKNQNHNPIFYILACRIGPFIAHYKREIERLGGKLYVNPDGHEWLREKWSKPVRKYWKVSEGLMVKYADLLICDSKNIEKYIQKDYKKFNPITEYISYGTDIVLSNNNKDQDMNVIKNWYKNKQIQEGNYYLVVGRFVPENNYEAMISEFMKSKSERDLVLITNVEENSFYKKLLKKTNFLNDSRIKFVGTVYNQKLLNYIRKNAFAYIHGHEVGGTNPSLLEALGATNINLLLNVGFNSEVGEQEAIYWEKNDLNLVINNLEKINNLPILNPQKLIVENYSWDKIISKYETEFRK